MITGLVGMVFDTDEPPFVSISPASQRTLRQHLLVPRNRRSVC